MTVMNTVQHDPLTDMKDQYEGAEEARAVEERRRFETFERRSVREYTVVDDSSAGEGSRR
jgi:hypothetical protein